MSNVESRQISPLISDTVTTSYSSLDWARLTESWKMSMYITVPGSDEPVDKPSTTYSEELQAVRAKSFEEVMEEVLEDRAAAWEQLADL